ncbi:uncharacterized protein N7479_010425 [Penicillium vulpinum]|uniref:Protein kinase domain-containing protein n=1 Tax=Penicillium vulpinum TaxID=29845 RepID=A0A1V6S9S5_9EURO|nr:uncharacterized protein N7479_010425 [Penicillium vulpinum]KAJ5952012.1 hypothetical protein N7479_010425 [Penicillium vulpinum]OQE10474.1 hypothetical protein PENVUL_c004G00064 [Penicillium vulpinum]
MRPPHQAIDHHHSLIRGKSSAERPSKDSAIKINNLPLLESVPTDQQPLLRQDSTPSISTQSTQSIQSLSSHSTQLSIFPSPNLPFLDKYGRYRQMVHYGTNSTTRLHESKPTKTSNPHLDNQLVAIKVYRRSILRGPPSSSHSTSLHPNHPNILPILDILHNERDELCLVMPYCAGGDLNTLLTRKGALPIQEADCIIAQILRALAFLHDYGLAHRDVRLETVLLTANGAVKLAGFGDGHIQRIWEESGGGRLPSRPQISTHSAWSFTLPWPLNSLRRQNSDSESSSSNNGSKHVIANSPTASFVGMRLPYIPPEEFKLHFQSHMHRDDKHGSLDECDSRPADVWATAMVYMALVTDKILWRSARPNQEDARYLDYLDARRSEHGYPPIETLGQRRGNAIYAMLHPYSWKRITATTLLRSEWINGVAICDAGENGY